MDFSLTSDQLFLRDVVRSTMAELAGDQVLVALHGAPTGYVPVIWDRLSQSGWLGLAVPEAYGGSGASLSDMAVVYEELGRGPLPQIYFVASALSPRVVQACATEEQRARLLPAIANGDARITVACTEDDHGWTKDRVTTTLRRTSSGFVLDGHKCFVPDVVGSTALLVIARVEDTDRVLVVLIPPDAPGVAVRPIEGFMSWQSRVTFDSVPVAGDDLLGDPDGDSWDALEAAIEDVVPLLCSFQVGSCQSVFEMSLQHTRTRIQFGQPIGRFQRVQDHLIELVNHLDAARWATYEAVWGRETQAASAKASLHMTKSIVSDGHWEVCDYGHEIHAGLGVDLRYGLAKHTYLSRTLYHFLGEPRWHRARMADALDW